MKKFKSLMALALCVTMGMVGCSSPTDTGKVEAEAKNEPQIEEGMAEKKIIAGTFMSAELLDLFDINPVGVLTSEKALPERYKDVAKIGSPMKPDLEVVASLSPELYVSDSNLKEALDEMFKGMAFETMYLTNNSYENVFQNIENVGERLDKTNKANEIIKEMRDQEKKIMDAIAGKEAPKVLILFGTPESFMIATPHSYTGSLVEKLGGINVAEGMAAGRPSPYLPYSLETVAELNPDIILRLTHVSPEVSRKAFDAEFAKGFWTNLDAVKNGEVYDLDNENFGVSANLRAVKALEKMAKILYK